MDSINLDGKVFKLLNNSSNGQVDSQTLFRYKQDGDLVTADYSGGSVVYGKIIARQIGDKLEMLYNCLTNEKELKAGKALASIALNSEGKIQLDLKWEWLENNKTGCSTYLEL